MSDYPPFSGDDPRCPKCGHLGAFTTWREAGHCLPGGVVQGYEPNERLCRACSRCDYHWDEAVVPVGGEMLIDGESPLAAVPLPSCTENPE